MSAQFEHANLTVPDPDHTATWLAEVFGWHIRWRGDAINGGYTVHIGSQSGYLALYRPNAPLADKSNSYTLTGGLNHVGLVVTDLKETENRVIAAGFTPHNHADYEPGQRFYFHDENDIEFEVVQYD